MLKSSEEHKEYIIKWLLERVKTQNKSQDISLYQELEDKYISNELLNKYIKDSYILGIILKSKVCNKAEILLFIEKKCDLEVIIELVIKNILPLSILKFILKKRFNKITYKELEEIITTIIKSKKDFSNLDLQIITEYIILILEEKDSYINAYLIYFLIKNIDNLSVWKEVAKYFQELFYSKNIDIIEFLKIRIDIAILLKTFLKNINIYLNKKDKSDNHLLALSISFFVNKIIDKIKKCEITDIAFAIDIFRISKTELQVIINSSSKNDNYLAIDIYYEYFSGNDIEYKDIGKNLDIRYKKIIENLKQGTIRKRVN